MGRSLRLSMFGMFDGEFPDATLVCSLSFRGEGLTPSGKRWNRTDDGFIVEIVLFGRLRSVAARPMVHWDIGTLVFDRAINQKGKADAGNRDDGIRFGTDMQLSRDGSG
jgi:hypothetical protein